MPINITLLLNEKTQHKPTLQQHQLITPLCHVKKVLCTVTDIHDYGVNIEETVMSLYDKIVTLGVTNVTENNSVLVILSSCHCPSFWPAPVKPSFHYPS